MQWQWQGKTPRNLKRKEARDSKKNLHLIVCLYTSSITEVLLKTGGNVAWFFLAGGRKGHRVVNSKYISKSTDSGEEELPRKWEWERERGGTGVRQEGKDGRTAQRWERQYKIWWLEVIHLNQTTRWVCKGSGDVTWDSHTASAVSPFLFLKPGQP